MLKADSSLHYATQYELHREGNGESAKSFQIKR